MTIKSDRDQVVAEVGQRLPLSFRERGGGEGWPWLELRYPAKKGRLLVCGFGIIRQWEATPAPRYLISELFLRLTAEKPVKPVTPRRKEELTMRTLTRWFALPATLLLCTALAAQAEDKEKKAKTPQVYPAAVLPFQERGRDTKARAARSPICSSPSWLPIRP